MLGCNSICSFYIDENDFIVVFVVSIRAWENYSPRNFLARSMIHGGIRGDKYGFHRNYPIFSH